MIKDYEKLGLKVGLEFHQRLDTHKLFCKCSSDMIEEGEAFELRRKLRPVVGEMGEVDPAALLESMKDRTFVYHGFKNSSCLVEADESPPEEINREALDIALEIALLLNCDVVDEVHVMRKTVIDGSNTSGFQRTMMIGEKGRIETSQGRVEITGVFLEEEAAGVIGERGKEKEYRLDRLGIPLVEISTGVMKANPDQVQKTALALGTLLRITGKVKRGLGTIRQDVNVSIKEGARVEIKGVQDIRLLKTIIEKEVQRQLRLVELRREFEKRRIRKLKPKVIDFTDYFKNTESKLILKGMKEGKKVSGIILPNFKGLLGFNLTPERRFGTELAGVVKVLGVKGIIHSDEDLSKYKIAEQVKKIRKDCKMKEKDALVLVIIEEEKAGKVFEQLVERINRVLEGVPEETRKALPDGNTEFMRSLAGAHRMYPETDVPPVLITKQRIEKIRKQLPERPEKLLERFISLGLSKELANKMILSKKLRFFQKALETKANPVLIATVLEDRLTELRREGVKVEAVKEEDLLSMFKAVVEEKLSKEAIPEVIRLLAEGENFENVLKKFEKIPEEELLKKAKELLEKLKETEESKKFKVLMGLMMKEFRGKADGRIIAKVVREVLK